MTAKTSSKKGFTIVELVITIAVIAVLSAILIPTFIGLTQKANERSDDSLVANLNKALAIREHEVGDTKNLTYQDAIDDLKLEGYLANILVTKSDKTLLWCSVDNRFHLANNGVVENMPAGATNLECWGIYNSMPTTQTFSIYAGPKWSEEVKEVSGLKVGFDAGENEFFTNVSYVGGDVAQEATIRTNSALCDIGIDAAADTVNHFGKVGKVTIDRIDMNCYNEFGAATYVKVTEGKVVAKNNGKISIVFADNTLGSAVAVMKETAGIINSGYTRVEEVDVTNQARAEEASIGIPLKYAIYVDETTVISGEDFAQFVESTAEYAVSTAKKIEEEVQREQHDGPTGTFVNPFVIEHGSLDSSDIEAGKSYYFNEDGFYDEDENEIPYADDLGEVIDYLSGQDIETWAVDDESVADFEFEDITGGTITAKAAGTTTITIEFDDETVMEFTITVVGDAPAELTSLCKIERTGVEYDDMMAASAAALTGDTITLLRDAESIPYFQAKNDKSITFDLNGHYVEDLAIRSITVTIIDSSDEKTGRVGNLDFSCWYGVENPNFVSDSFKDDVERNDYHEGQGYQYLEMWTERPAKLTLLGGSYKAIHLSNCADVEIAGAYIFNADEITYTTGYAINVGEYQYVSISMKSGVLAGETSIGNRVSVSVSGGIFSKEVPSSHLAEGYTCIKISEGIYQVVAK